MVNTNNCNIDPISPIFEISESRETLTEQRRRWAHLLRSQHYQTLIAEVLEQELPKYENSTVINTTNTVQHMHDCALILASASPVLTAAVTGNLVAQIQIDTDLQSAYTALSDRARYQPSIYAHFLSDKGGMPPTPNQYLAIRTMIQDYINPGSTSDHAWHIDNVTSPPVTHEESIRGHRKYLFTSARSAKREQTLRHFCTGIQALCSEIPTYLHNTPLPYPPAECGYSRRSHDRISHHRMHHSSNYIMNLVEDTCTYLYQQGVFQQHFTMHPFILFLIFERSQAAMAEILCSALLQVWAERGGGFNACPAGRSVKSVMRVGEVEWEMFGRRVREESGFVGNMRVQMERVEMWLRALDWGNENERDGEAVGEEGEC